MNSWKIFIKFFFQKFLISGKSPAAKNIFFLKIFFSKCISSGVFQDFSKIPKGTVRGQLTLTKLVSGITKIFFSLPPAVKMWKHAAWFDILTPRGKKKMTFVIPLANLVKVNCPLTVPFRILEKSWKTPEEIHFEKNIFAKKIFFAAGDFPNMRNFWKKILMKIF